MRNQSDSQLTQSRVPPHIEGKAEAVRIGLTRVSPIGAPDGSEACVGRRNIWQEFRQWLQERPRLRSDRSPLRAGHPSTTPIGTAGLEPHEWPSNVLPFVRPGQPESLTDRDGSVAAALTLDGPSAEAELLEFLAADLDPIPADPVFREQLREKLWEIVERDSASRRGRSRPTRDPRPDTF